MPADRTAQCSIIRWGRHEYLRLIDKISPAPAPDLDVIFSRILAKRKSVLTISKNLVTQHYAS